VSVQVRGHFGENINLGGQANVSVAHLFRTPISVIDRPSQLRGGEVMMTRRNCEDCGQPIPNGAAHIRSVLFSQVAYCGACWAIRNITTVLRRAS
jgi:hypothetical protein